jgi:diguanylate cyclase (GGDEF)-like protein
MLNGFKRKLYIMLSISIILSIFIISFAKVIYYAIESNVIDELKKSANNIAVTAAEFIEHDIEPYIALSTVEDYSQGNYDIEYYNKMLQLFQGIKRKTGVSYIFTEKKISDTEVAYLIDGEVPGSENFSPIGLVDELGEYERQAFQNGNAVATPVIEDERWGNHLSGFAPITDPDTGNIVGLVGVDFSLKYVEKFISNIKLFIIVITFVSIVFTTIVSYKLMDSRRKALYTDHLTGVYSKRYHEKALKKAIKKAQTSNEPLSLIMIDVDYFKQINDKYGHVAGDIVIKNIAQNIKKSIRTTDFCSRFGGDEFIIILPDTDKERAKNIAQRIADGMLNLNYVTKKELDIELDLTLSIGIAQWTRDTTEIELVKHADRAMYLSKTSGRNKITVN